MMKRWSAKKIRFAVAMPLLLAAASSFFLTACSPEWIDASSCIYLTVEGKVMVRDIDQKKSREICTVERGDATNNYLGKWLKLSPDKDQFVIAYLTGEKDDQAIVFDFYSLDGKKLESSKPIRLPVEVEIEGLVEPVPGIEIDPDTDKAEASGNGSDFTNMHWSQDGKYILATLDGMNGTVSYHVERKTHRVHRRVGYGCDDFQQTFSPITPDGKSFVAEARQGAAAFSLVSLESGKTLHEFDTKDVLDNLSGPEGRVYLRPYWRENTLVHPLKDGELLFDVVNKTLEFRSTEVMKKLHAHAFANECNVVGVIGESLIVEFKHVGNGAARGIPKTEFSVFNVEENSREILKGFREVSLFSVSKSVDQRRTMLCGISANAGGKQAQVVVMDAEARVIDSFKYAVAREER